MEKSVERSTAQEPVLVAKGANDGPSLLSVLRARDFRLLWAGQSISLLGDQFHMIALPWLVLQLTGNALAMGTVLALAGIPRALFMLVGGALTDRFSPRTVMLASTILRLALVALLAGVVLTGLIQLWMLYFFAVAFGLMDAFFFPAQSAIVPQLIDKELLQAGNALIQGTAQISLFVGPVLAGTMIALLNGQSVPPAGTTTAVPDLQGIGIAFGFDAFTFLVSAATLWPIRTGKPMDQSSGANGGKDMVSSIREGLVAVWYDPPLRIIFFVVAALNLLTVGPFMVGIPVLAESRFVERVAAYGVIMTAYGGGSLLGTVLAGVLPAPKPQHFGLRLMFVASTLGLGLALLGVISSTITAALVSLAMGAANGYVVIMFITWLQKRTPQAMLGRMMSVLMFAAVGMVPVSTAVAGALIDFNATLLFVVAGALLTTIILLSGLNPAIHTMGLEQSKPVG